MKLSLFDFELPDGHIALRPASPRDAARMLVVGPEGRADTRVAALADHLRAGDLMVINDTRVIPARLKGRRGAARVEVTLHKRLDAVTWRAFARPAKRLHPGDRIDFSGLTAEVTAKGEGGEVSLRFEVEKQAFRGALERVGEMPLPPYIAGRRAPDERDRTDYQTIFAAAEGAVAAPTAGLHFSDRMLAALDRRGVGRTRVTLHVGAGTFLPVKTEDIADHVMHAEHGVLSAQAAARINAVRSRGGRIVAIGTTSLRLLEAAAAADGEVRPFDGDTDIFIAPGYRFRAVDMLVTNFHLPRSTLFMLVSAFAGLEPMRAAYRHAIAGGYRFYSYGDACLLYRAP